MLRSSSDIIADRVLHSRKEGDVVPSLGTLCDGGKRRRSARSLAIYALGLSTGRAEASSGVNWELRAYNLALFGMEQQCIAGSQDLRVLKPSDIKLPIRQMGKS